MQTGIDASSHYEPVRRKPHPTDTHVGSRLRYRRMIIGMSQEKLGERMNLTFQQIQKYEKGTNRIGASRLFQLSKVLDVPVGYFFEDAFAQSSPATDAGEEGAEPLDEVQEFVRSKEGLSLIRTFLGISDPRVRTRVIALIKTMANRNENTTGEAI